MNAIDTNILIYRVDQQEHVKRPLAEDLLKRLSANKDTVLLWQVLAEFARWLTSKQHAQQIEAHVVRDYLDVVRQQFTLVMPTPPVLDLALDLADRYSLSHWDSMLLAACVDAGVTTLYTEDMGAPRTMDSIDLVNPF